MASAQMGSRMNHSCRMGPASAAKRTPKGTPKDIPRALIQKMSTGLDMNQPSCAHQVVIQSSRDKISRATSE